MADGAGRSATSLETWTVATFDVVVFGLLAVLVGHASGALGDVLPDVGTVPGILTFGYLWALVFLAMRWVLGENGLAWGEDRSLGRLLARGVAGGSFVGTAFVAGSGTAAGLIGLASGVSAATVAFVILFGAVGGAIGGALVGLVFGLLDVLLARGADAVVDRLVG